MEHNKINHKWELKQLYKKDKNTKCLPFRHCHELCDCKNCYDLFDSRDKINKRLRLHKKSIMKTIVFDPYMDYILPSIKKASIHRWGDHYKFSQYDSGNIKFVKHKIV
jgi:hypothetical protein